MNVAGNLSLWGYRVPKTEVLRELLYRGDSARVVGREDFGIAWNAFEEFEKVNVSGNFVAEFEFTHNTKETAENWNKWVLVFRTGERMWYLRADSYSLETLGGENSVKYWSAWGNDFASFNKAFDGAKVRLRIEKDDALIHVYAYLRGRATDGSDSLVYAVTATGTPNGDYEILLGADEAMLKIDRIATGKLENRIAIGTINDGGEYTSAFNAEKTPDYRVTGDFNATLHFVNYGNKPVYGPADANIANNWDNYIVRSSVDGVTTLLRADAYALDNMGTFSYEFDWKWEDFAHIMQNADVLMKIFRRKDTVSYLAQITANDGSVYHYGAVNAGASTAEMSLGLTCEKSVIELLSVSVTDVVENQELPGESTPVARKKTATDLQIPARVFDVRGRYLGRIKRDALETGNLPSSFRNRKVYGK